MTGITDASHLFLNSLIGAMHIILKKCFFFWKAAQSPPQTKNTLLYRNERLRIREKQPNYHRKNHTRNFFPPKFSEQYFIEKKFAHTEQQKSRIAAFMKKYLNLTPLHIFLNLSL